MPTTREDEYRPGPVAAFFLRLVFFIILPCLLFALFLWGLSNVLRKVEDSRCATRWASIGHSHAVHGHCMVTLPDGRSVPDTAIRIDVSR